MHNGDEQVRTNACLSNFTGPELAHDQKQALPMNPGCRGLDGLWGNELSRQKMSPLCDGFPPSSRVFVLGKEIIVANLAINYNDKLIYAERIIS